MNEHIHIDAALEDYGGYSATMRRIEMLIRKHAPTLLVMPETNPNRPIQPTRTWQKKEMVRLFNEGKTVSEVVKILGCTRQSAGYYKRYANGSVPATSVMRVEAVQASAAI